MRSFELALVVNESVEESMYIGYSNLVRRCRNLTSSMIDGMQMEISIVQEELYH